MNRTPFVLLLALFISAFSQELSADDKPILAVFKE